jgi:hypothetical protein
MRLSGEYRSGKWCDRRGEWLAIAVTAAVLYVSYLIARPGIGYDGEQYLTYARNLLSTGMFTFDGVTPSCGRAPGYPFFLAAILWVTGGISWVYPVQMALLLVSYWLMARALAPYLPPMASAVLLVVFAILWPLHRLGMALMSEPLFMALTALSIFLLHRYFVRKQWPALASAGLVLGLSAYIRPVNLLAAVFLGAFLLWRRRLSWRGAVLLIVAGVLAVAPWTYRNWVVFHRLVPMAAHHGSLYYMTDGEVFWPVLLHSAGYSHTLPIYREIVGDDLELDWQANERYWAYARRNIARDPIGFVGRCFAKTIFVWGYLPGTKGWIFTRPWLFAAGAILQWTFLVFAFRGLVLLRGRSPGLSDTILGYTVYTALILFPFYAESRFLLPVYTWLFGTAWLWLVLRRPDWWARARLLVGVR